MPGRQSHGRPLLGGGPSSSKGKGRSKNKASKKKALDAFAIAQEEYGDRLKQNPRNRGLDAELSGGRSGAKHARDEEDDDDDDDDEGEDEDGAPPRKMRRGAGGRTRADEDIEYGSDSSGNEWQIGVPDDDDSEIDSDEAFGESDQEKFDGYAFRGSKKKNKKQADEDDEDEDDEDDDIDDADGASLGSDAIDLADALDMSMSEDEGGPDAGQEEHDSDSDDESGSEESKSGDESSDIDDDEVDDVSESGINEWVSQFAGVKDAEEEATSTTTKPKLGLKDLGLLGVKDPQLKKSLKLMSKEEKSSKPKKLDVPLARRQQAQIDRAAAYEKTKQSLDRWTETVKHNRRADHLVFPLPQNEVGLARHDNTEIMPLNPKTTGTELEQTIMAIIEESGLGPSAEKEKKNTQDDDELDNEGLSRTDRKALWQQKRRERELKSREDARAKRIAKIKSKAYHRVHKKQEQREAMKEHEAKVAAGEIDSEEEREAQDRQRAMERMGARHRESKWAKMSNKGGRAAWDESVRMGVTDMARRDEELRRRIEGKSSKAHDDDDDSDSDYSGDSEDGDERKRLLRQLNNVSAVKDTEPKSKLMSMEFMQKAENAKKKANDELIAQMRRELGSDNDDQSGSDDEPEYIGRRKFGQPSGKTEKPNEPVAKASKQGISKGDIQEARENFAKATTNRSKGLSAPVPQGQNTNPTAGAWSQAATSGPAKKQKGKSGSGAVVLDLGADSVVITPSAGPVKSSKPSKKPVTPNDDYSSDDDVHMPIEFHEQELIERAFGGLDVVGEFEKEKAAVESEDDEKIVDNTLPGWGSWAGEGISKREKNRHKGRFLTKKDGVRKKDRKDAKLKNVIISEKIVKKNTKYMASQLPHPFDSRATYEQSLRLPMGPEWLTKESFQDVTKPKVIMKQGIIAPISKPTH